MYVSLSFVSQECPNTWQLDEVLPKPALLSYTCYALYFVCFYTTATNSMQFARQAIIASTNDTSIRDERVMRLIAVVITTVICALIYFSTATGRRLNRYLAWLKIGLLISVFMTGAIKAGKSTVHDKVPTQKFVKSTSASALLQVLYAFQGWENATLVRTFSVCNGWTSAYIARLLVRFLITIL
jgi:amino acid transporter